MSIQLIITADFSTDLVAEIQTLAAALGGTVPAQAPKHEAGATTVQTASTTSAPSQPAETSTEAPVDGGKTDEKKTLSRKEQDAAEAEMIAAGAKDARYELLTKGRQNAVDAAIAKAAAAPAETAKDADLDDMFSDSAPAAKTGVTRDQVSELMGKIGKDKDGNPIQARLLKIREILVDNIPEGQEIKVRNLPEDKLDAVFALIEKVEA
jgi:hypothetical protein